MPAEPPALESTAAVTTAQITPVELAPPAAPAAPTIQRWVKRALPWLASFTLNLLLMVVLALLTVSGLLERLYIPLEVSVAFEQSAEAAPLDLPEIGEASSAELSASFLAAEPDDTQPAAEAMDVSLSKEMLPSPQRIGPTAEAGALDSPGTGSRKAGLLGLPSKEDLNALVPTTTARGPVTEKELRERTSLRDVALDVGDEIKEKLNNDNLLVVWLLDGSLSLVDNRKELATHLDIMYANLDQQLVPVKGKKKRLLMNATVGYGAGVEAISPPYRVPTRATVAMKEMGVDPTGLENVCQAIMWTAYRAREGWSEHRGQIMIVVFTDESGDDLQYLEETIEACRYFKVSVSFIGPTAILGTNEGYHKYFHPQVPNPFWLPVMKGPDTAVTERLRLPYWWSTENLRTKLNLPAEAREFPTDRKIAAEWEAKLPEWARGAEVNPSDYFTGSYSGRELLNLNSGFPPWGLMRIARETGGTYTMFDRQGDRGPFRLQLMRPYTPDYRSIPEILDEMQQHPLQMAVVNAVALTRQFAPRVTPTVRFWNGYSSPEQFRVYCNKALPAADEHAARTATLIEQALAGFGPDGMEKQYENESPRWKAWYDLTVGRLMLQSVRFAEYRMTIRMIDDPRGFPNKANQINLFPYATIRAGEKSYLRAEKGQLLLERCLKNNPGTPWAFLAARELEHPLSIDFNWRYVPPPPPSPGGPVIRSQPGPQITLPKL